MPRVVSDGTHEVYVYANDHNPPHCHLYWNAAEGEAVVDLRTLQVVFGTPTKHGLDFVAKHVDAIRTMWNLLNPSKAVP